LQARFRHRDRRFIGGGFDDIEQVPDLDGLPLVERALLQEAFDARPDIHGIDGFDAGDKFGAGRDVLDLDGLNHDGRRWGLRRCALDLASA